MNSWRDGKRKRLARDGGRLTRGRERDGQMQGETCGWENERAEEIQGAVLREREGERRKRERKCRGRQ